MIELDDKLLSTLDFRAKEDEKHISYSEIANKVGQIPEFLDDKIFRQYSSMFYDASGDNDNGKRAQWAKEVGYLISEEELPEIFEYGIYSKLYFNYGFKKLSKILSDEDKMEMTNNGNRIYAIDFSDSNTGNPYKYEIIASDEVYIPELVQINKNVFFSLDETIDEPTGFAEGDYWIRHYLAERTFKIRENNTWKELNDVALFQSSKSDVPYIAFPELVNYIYDTDTKTIYKKGATEKISDPYIIIKEGIGQGNNNGDYQNYNKYIYFFGTTYYNDLFDKNGIFQISNIKSHTWYNGITGVEIGEMPLKVINNIMITNSIQQEDIKYINNFFKTKP